MSARITSVTPVKVESAVTGGDGKVLTDPPTFAFGADPGPTEPAAAPSPGSAAGLDPSGL